MQQLEQPELASVFEVSSLPGSYKSSRQLSSFLAAIVIFLLLNGVLSQMGIIHFNPFDYPSRGWTWWLIKDLKERGEKFNVALLGSSLMMSAVTGCDSEYLHRSLPANNHRTADYLEGRLNRQFNGAFKTFNLATPGQMPSDACLFLRTLLLLGQKPDCIIYGIAPRDFIDSTLAEPSETEPFNYLKRLVQTDDLVDHIYDAWPNRLNHYLERSFFFCSYSIDLQMKTWCALEKFLALILPSPPGQLPFTSWDRMKLLPDYKPTENSAYTFRDFHASSNNRSFDHWSTDNRQDYIQRYRYPNEHGFNSQCYFLKVLTESCNENKIQLILVNMPLSAANIELFTHSRYATFLRRLQYFAVTNHIAFYNFSDTKRYPDRLFRDSVHLNALGGKQLFDQLSDQLNNDSSVSHRFIISGQQLQHKQELAATSRRSI
jgi:hypothetical protein